MISWVFDDVTSPSSASVLDHFSALADPRQRWRVLYPLPEILLLLRIHETSSDAL